MLPRCVLSPSLPSYLWVLRRRTSITASSAVCLRSASCRAFWGDTGSFRLAFHLADKAFEFGEITVRPAAALDEPAHLPGQNPEVKIKTLASCTPSIVSHHPV